MFIQLKIMRRSYRIEPLSTNARINAKSRLGRCNNQTIEATCYLIRWNSSTITPETNRYENIEQKLMFLCASYKNLSKIYNLSPTVRAAISHIRRRRRPRYHRPPILMLKFHLVRLVYLYKFDQKNYSLSNLQIFTNKHWLLNSLLVRPSMVFVS